VLKGGSIRSVNVGAGHLVFSMSSLVAPAEVYRAAADGTGLTPLTRANEGWLKTVAFSQPESLTVNAAGGPVQYWLIKPPNFDPATRYPVVFLIHGGPQGVWGDAWSTRWNPSLWAAQGWVVVAPNPRGSHLTERPEKFHLTRAGRFTILNRMVKYSQAALDATFGALADPTRRAILARLAQGETSVSELAQPFRMSLAAVTKHLRVLDRAGLLEHHKDGRVRRCRLHPQPLKNAAEWIAFYQRFWEDQFDALEEFIADMQKEDPSWRPQPRPKPSSSHEPSPPRGKKSSKRG
jgi:DNA-binding transcriptional ArsR family regulator